MTKGGHLTIDRQRRIVYHRSDGDDVIMAVDDVKLIGEYTTAAGPWGDDWFLVLVESFDSWREIPAYMPGCDDLLRGLSFALREPITWGLANSAQLKSRVIWPLEIAGAPLFRYYPVRPEGVREHLVYWLGMGPVRFALTPEVVHCLQQRAAGPHYDHASGGRS